MGYGKRPGQPHIARQEAGFTLVEILLALLIFAFMAGIIFAAFKAVADGVERGRQSMDVYRVGRAALLRMAQEISAAMPPPAPSAGSSTSGSDTGLQGRKGSGGGGLAHDRIDFLTIPYRRYSDKLPGFEICKVAYYVAENQQGRAALWREEDCSGEEDERHERTTRLELTDLAVGLDIAYYDARKDYEEWPLGGYDDNPLPCLVRLALTLRDAQQHERTFMTTVALPMRGACEDQQTQSFQSGGLPRR